MDSESSEQKKHRTLALKGRDVRSLNDLYLNLTDLTLCLRLMTDNKDVLWGKPSDLKVALWTAIITKYFSCFGNSDSRRTLNAGKVFKNNPNAQSTFYKFSNIRNKHIVHDENNMIQSNAVIQIDEGVVARPFKIMIVGGDAASHDVDAMGVLLSVSIEFAQNALNVLIPRIQAQVDAMSLEDIGALEEWRLNLPVAIFGVDKSRVRLD